MTEEEKNLVNDENLDPNEFEDDEKSDQKKTDTSNDANKSNSNNPSPTKSEEELEKEKRAEYARKRREKEAKEKAEKERLAHEEQIRKETETKTKLGIVKENPWTKKPVTDEKDLEIYEIMKELEDKGLDPLGDLPNALAERNRAKAKADDDANKEKKLIENQLVQEIRDLRKKYPDVNTQALGEDPLYNEIAEEKGGRWTVTEIYEEYARRKGIKDKSNVSNDGSKKVNEIAKNTNKQTSATGGSSNSGSSKPISEMTDEEFREYYRKKYKR